MKMSKELYNELDTLITEVITSVTQDKIVSHRENLIELNKYEKEYTNLRVRLAWDIFYTIPREQRFEWVDKAYYNENLKDNHITTALVNLLKIRTGL